MQWAVRLVVYCAFGYLGMMLAMRSNRDEFSLIIPYVRFTRRRRNTSRWSSIPMSLSMAASPISARPVFSAGR